VKSAETSGRSDSVKSHIALFNVIAFPYGWFFRFEKARYGAILRLHLDALSLASGSRVLDVGCGPGAFAAAFRADGFQVTGVDGAPKMAEQALAHGIECHVADASLRLPFGAGEFDLVAAAYVAHGLRHESRIALYREMKRVSTGPVLLHDFSPSVGVFPPWSIIGLLERLEGSDYRVFVSRGLEELREVFASVHVTDVGRTVSWYVCR
jgi:SAM-dependent methyltransferase